MTKPHVGAPIDTILGRLLALHPKRIDLSLDRMWHVLERLGHPEKSLPPIVHVAGTNGKGSTIAFMRAMLEAAGARVHVYTSPNLVRLNERFRLGRPGGGVLVSDADLARALETCEQANGDAPITVSLTIRPTLRCSKSGSAAGSTPPMWCRSRLPASSRRYPWTMWTSSATPWKRSRARKPQSSGAERRP
jgi:hypothetical protein